MTNPLSPPDADTSNAASPGAENTRKPRKAPRRATAPAGAPANSAKSAPALLTVGADGMVVPSPVSTDDAGNSPAADAAPLVVVEVEAAAGELAGAEADSDSADSDGEAEAEAVEAGAVVESADSGSADSDTAAEAKLDGPAGSESSVPDASAGDSATADDSEAAKADLDDQSAEETEEIEETESTADSPADESQTDGDDVPEAVETRTPGDTTADGATAKPGGSTDAPAVAVETPANDDVATDAIIDNQASAVPEAPAVGDAGEAEDSTASAGTQPSAEVPGGAVADKAEESTDAPVAEVVTVDAVAGKDAGSSPAAEDNPAAEGTASADEVSADVTAASPRDESSAPEPENGDSDAAATDTAAGTPAEAEAPGNADPSVTSAVDGDGDGNAPTPNDEAEPAVDDGKDSVADKAGDPSGEAAPDDAAVEASESAPLSRRERRLAEQKAGPGVEADKRKDSETAVEPTGLAAGETSSNTPEAPEPAALATSAAPEGPAKKRKGIAPMIRGLLFLAVIAVVVAATGTVLAGQKDDATGPSSTEVNRQDAWARTTALLAQATELSKSASTPKLQEALDKTATDLATQAAALGDGLPPSTAVPTSAATVAAPATVANLAAGLKDSGQELLADAVTAEQAMGRVFAAAGTSQLLQGQELGAANGIAAAASELAAARVNFPSPSGPECSSTLEPRPGVTVDSALLAAAHGEQKAVYAYQVATTRFAEPQFGKASEMLGRHQQKLDLLNAELTVRCLPLAVPVAGFALDPSFTASPAQALAGLESELGTIYADLAALSTPAAGEEPAGSDSSAAPSAAAGATALPTGSPVQGANNGLLREMSVAWLLDSSAAQTNWGGTVGALAGMNP